VRQKSIAESVGAKREKCDHPIEDDWTLRETTAVCQDSTRNKRHGVRLQAYPAARRALSAVI
jgi:hypothetical protein